MVNVKEFLNDCQKEVDKFKKGKVFYAFGSNEKEREFKLIEQGVRREDVVCVGSGAYVKISSIKEIRKFLDDLQLKKTEFYKRNLYESLIYLLWDYELYFNGGLENLLKETMGLDDEFIKKNAKIINRAVNNYREAIEEQI